MSDLKLKDPVKFTWALIAVTTIIRLIIAGTTGLGTGESYYARGALDLQLSYFDQPPLFFWLSGLSLELLGVNNFAIRLPAVLLFIGTQWLLFLLTQRLFNSWAGFFSVLILNFSFVFTVPIAAWFQPDAPLMFFWLLSCFLLLKIFFLADGARDGSPEPEENPFLMWCYLGTALGLTALSKYHAILFVASGFILVVIDARQRHWIRHPAPYVALFIALLISIPVLIWNSENGWVSFTFQGSRAGSGQGFELRFDRLLRSIVGQALWLAPWIWIPLLGQLVASYHKRKTSPSYAFIFWMAVIPIVFFTIITLWSRTGFHFHWQAPGYLMLFIPLGALVANQLTAHGSSKRRTRRWLIGSGVATVSIAILLLVHTETGLWRTYGPAFLIEKSIGKSDPTIEGTDYDEIAQRFDKEGWLEEDDLFVGSTRWWQAGKIDWPLKGKMEVIIFDRDPRNYAFLSEPKKYLGSNAIIVTHSSSQTVETNVAPFFDQLMSLDGIEILRNGVIERTLDVYYGTNFRIPEKPFKDMPLYRQLIGAPPFNNLD